MKTMARVYLKDIIGSGFSNEDIEKYAIQKDQNWKEKFTVWIFNDGSALAVGIGEKPNITPIDNYGLSPDNEQIRRTDYD